VGNLSACGVKETKLCDFKNSQIIIENICEPSKMEFNPDIVLYNYIKEIVLGILYQVKPPITCSNFKKDKYVLSNYTLDLSMLNVFPLEAKRWIMFHSLTMGPDKVPFICFEHEFIVRKLK
jgi:hypothetical protein